jgi:hypothetical protein
MAIGDRRGKDENEEENYIVDGSHGIGVVWNRLHYPGS